MKTLAELLSGLPVDLPPGAAELAVGSKLMVSGVAHDSRRVEAGDLFVTWSGARADGARFAPEAVARGAVAVLADQTRPEDLPAEALAPTVPWLVAAAPRDLLGALASRAYNHPDRALRLIGVTGTNGKSTVTQLVAAAVEAAGTPCGIMGTLGYFFRGEDLGFGRTTPEASDFFRVLARMYAAGAQRVVMEVSSHALSQGRIGDATFEVAVFTNLTRDHFDFHTDLDDYFAAKRRLFTEHSPGGVAVVGQDDEYGRRLIGELRAAGRPVLSFGDQGDVVFSQLELSPEGIRGRLETPRGAFEVQSSLLGRYNATNILAAAATAEALELPHEAFVAAVAAQQPLPGRLERVEIPGARLPFPVYVDYAHTDAALRAAISSLKELSGRRVLVVFGCGGDRDPGKRPLMGQAAGELADFVVLTSDNPRSEDPMAILAAAEVGLKASGNPSYLVVPDRRAAIRRALAAADADSAVLVAGRGHERVQIFRDGTVPFSDLDEIRQGLSELAALQTSGKEPSHAAAP
jgi:UDP-N-acetylmuramoyl-L-alanyl-D-glutamate--2,6-diaminopimelate ligase